MQDGNMERLSQISLQDALRVIENECFSFESRQEQWESENSILKVNNQQTLPFSLTHIFPLL